MTRNAIGSYSWAGGKCIRLFAFLLSAIALHTTAQVAVHYQSSDLTLHPQHNVLAGTVAITLKNTGDTTITQIRLLYWPLAYTQQDSKLALEFLENQNARMRFAAPHELGGGRVTLDTTKAQNNINSFHLAAEMTVLPLVLRPGEERTLHCVLQTNLPHAQFNGYGINASSVRLSHWLPRISAASNQYADTYNSSNREAWFFPATYSLMLTIANGGALCSNLNIHKTSSGPAQSYRLTATKPQSDALLIVYNNSANLPVQGDSSTVILHFENNFPAFNTTTSLRKTVAFLQRELGWQAPDTLHLVFVKNRGSIHSAGHCIVLEENNTQEDVEGDLIAALVQTYAREVLLVNPAAHPFLVEGLSNYYKQLYFNVHYPNKMLLGPLAKTFVARFLDVDHYPISYQNRMLYLYMVRQGLDQPLNGTSSDFSRFNREAVIKGKSALWFSYLRSYVGEKNFLRGMRRWAQHSDGSPQSLLAAMQYYHNTDLSWFLGDLYTTAKKLDYKIKKAAHCTSVYTATVKNKGNLTVPFSTTGYNGQTPVLTEWHSGFKGKKTVQIHLEDYTSVKLDDAHAMPETSERNNTVRTSGHFRTVKPLKFQFYTSFENPERTQIFWLPSVKYNAYDNLLLGAQFTNANLFRKPIEWKLAPDYSTGTGSLTGMGSLRFNWTPYAGPFHLVSFGVYGKYYHYAPALGYTRLSPTLSLYFRKNHPRSTWQHALRMRGVVVNRETAPAAEGTVPPNLEGPPNYRILDVRYSAENGALLRPFMGFADVQVADDFVKLSVELKQRWRLTKHHLVTARLFAGTMLHTSAPDPFFQFGASGTRDYLFDYYFIGRSDETGIWSQQMFFSDGGFRTQTDVFATTMLAANINVPFYRFVGAFGDVGFGAAGAGVLWDYGLYLEFIPDFIEIHFPIAGNQRVFIAQDNYLKNIRFVLNLELDAIINRVRRGWY